MGSAGTYSIVPLYSKEERHSNSMIISYINNKIL